MEDYERLRYVSANINRAALYEQLAEESTEVAKAALKLARIIRNENPAGTTFDEALDNVIEEWADVSLVADVIGLVTNADIYEKKLDRWVDRINGGRDKNNLFNEGEGLNS